MSNRITTTDLQHRPSRVALRGFERMVVWTDGVSKKVVHSMVVRGSTATLLRLLPVAVMRTFNTHPRMRALQIRGEPFAAEIQPPVTLEAVSTRGLLRVRHDDSSTRWQEYVEDECSIGFDRYAQLPFYLSVWVDDEASSARLMLFSDHYMSDGRSGLIVLNDVLEQAELLAKRSLRSMKDDDKLVSMEIKELLVYPSLYTMWLSKARWAKAVAKTLIALFGSWLYRSSVERFKPLLPARADLHDLKVPPVANHTSALFARGNAGRMQEVLAKCKEEGVTFGGALVAVVLLAFYDAVKAHGTIAPGQKFRLIGSVDYDMRQRVPCPTEEDLVGTYMAFGDLGWLATEGVDMERTRFWDLARRSKREMNDILDHTLAMSLSTILMDRRLNSQMQPSFLGSTRVAHCLSGDAGISNVGRYPYKKTFDLSTWRDGDSGGDLGGELSVESLHVFGTAPHLGASATVWISSVNAFNYSMAHKCEDAVGRALFSAIVTLCEDVGSIGTDDTLIEVANWLESS